MSTKNEISLQSARTKSKYLEAQKQIQKVSYFKTVFTFVVKCKNSLTVLIKAVLLLRACFFVSISSSFQSFGPK